MFNLFIFLTSFTSNMIISTINWTFVGTFNFLFALNDYLKLWYTYLVRAYFSLFRWLNTGYLFGFLIMSVFLNLIIKKLWKNYLFELLEISLATVVIPHSRILFGIIPHLFKVEKHWPDGHLVFFNGGQFWIFCELTFSINIIENISKEKTLQSIANTDSKWIKRTQRKHILKCRITCNVI